MTGQALVIDGGWTDLFQIGSVRGFQGVRAKGGGCIVEWRVQFLASHRSSRAAKSMVSTLVNAGLASLKARFGVAK